MRLVQLQASSAAAPAGVRGAAALRAVAARSASSAAVAAGAGFGRSAVRAPLGAVVSRRGISGSASARDSEEEVREITNPKVIELADRIVELNLLEVSDLTELIRQRLGLPAASAMPMGFGGFGAGAGPAAAAAPAEEAAPVEEKTSFDLKLDGFDAAAKIKVIKEVRAIAELGLKEAKELVEGSPAVIKKGLKKEEAEELKAKIEAVGGKVSIE